MFPELTSTARGHVQERSEGPAPRGSPRFVSRIVAGTCGVRVRMWLRIFTAGTDQFGSIRACGVAEA